ARRGQLLWLTLILAAATMVLTPMTAYAGQWLYDLRASPSPILREHADRGSQMIYFSAALLAVAIGLLVLRLIERRSEKSRMATNVIVVVVVALAVGISSMIQIYRIGDAGARSVWGGEIARLQKAHGVSEAGTPPDHGRASRQDCPAS
ncbi:MAG: hypothetical protein ACLP5J_14995, partial [Mycobacterium sp.]